MTDEELRRAATSYMALYTGKRRLSRNDQAAMKRYHAAGLHPLNRQLGLRAAPPTDDDLRHMGRTIRALLLLGESERWLLWCRAMGVKWRHINEIAPYTRERQYWGTSESSLRKRHRAALVRLQQAA